MASTSPSYHIFTTRLASTQEHIDPLFTPQYHSVFVMTVELNAALEALKGPGCSPISACNIYGVRLTVYRRVRGTVVWIKRI